MTVSLRTERDEYVNKVIGDVRAIKTSNLSGGLYAHKEGQPGDAASEDLVGFYNSESELKKAAITENHPRNSAHLRSNLRNI